MKQRFKSYKFWVSFSAALIILVQAIGKAFNIEIDGNIIDGIVMGFCGLLVVLGFVNKDIDEKDKDQKEIIETKDKEEDDNK